MNRGLFVWTEVLDYLHLYKKAHGFLRERFCFLAGATKLSRFRSTKEKRKRFNMSLSFYCILCFIPYSLF